MTRKDYVLLARAIEREVKNWSSQGGEREIKAIESLVGELGNELGRDNYRFSDYRFTKACGLLSE